MASVFIFWLLFLIVEIPSVDDFESRVVPESTKIFDSTGETLLWEIHGDQKRTTIPLEEISRNARNATIAIEDNSFYTHHGIRLLSLFRVIFLNTLQGKSIGSGGSTITQQLVKNTLLTPERTITRKIKEVVIAFKLETALTKDEILTLYLNEIPYGSNAYGIEAASQNYFGKSASKLSLAESAYLAALPKAPTYFSPYGSRSNELESRKNLVLTRMKEIQYITEDEYESAKNELVEFLPQSRLGIRAPHFVIYVREELIEKYGEEFVERGGLTVITTLDIELQEKAEEIVARKVEENTERFNATNASLIAIDPKTGRIITMVGSKDYFDIENNGNFNVSLGLRQPGSSFKPLVYATAFKQGYTPETVVFDLETQFAAYGEDYTPQNYDEVFRGPITLRNALAQSINVPAVKTLYLSGVREAIETARDFGISTLVDPSRYGLSLVLGGGEVKLLELTSAYSVFANKGIRTDYHPIIEVRDSSGKILEQERISSRRVLDENISNLVTDILSDNKARTPAFGARSPLYFDNHDVAAKTGTTNDFRDAWTIGYNPNLVVGAWAGNNDNSSMKKKVAGFIITPLWREFMDIALAKLDGGGNAKFTTPDFPNPKKPVLRGEWKGSQSFMVDKLSGKIATEYTPLNQQEEKIIQSIHSILYWVDKDDPDGDFPKEPMNDIQFGRWEEPVRKWAKEQNLKDEEIPEGFFEIDISHNPENWPVVIFTHTGEKISFRKDEKLIFYPQIISKFSVSQVDVFIDGNFVRSERQSISQLQINQDSLHLTLGDHLLTLRVYDVLGNKNEGVLGFSIN